MLFFFFWLMCVLLVASIANREVAQRFGQDQATSTMTCSQCITKALSIAIIFFLMLLLLFLIQITKSEHSNTFFTANVKLLFLVFFFVVVVSLFFTVYLYILRLLIGCEQVHRVVFCLVLSYQIYVHFDYRSRLNQKARCKQHFGMLDFLTRKTCRSRESCVAPELFFSMTDHRPQR